ncbi:MAG TPA: InlB B-repeat-containing protein [Acidimicrobiales bacterium]|nr:InlB B-repeat-containing protein [Acidimicrobiales bacterium]
MVTVPALSAGATTTAPVASPVSVGAGQVCATVSSAAVECFGIGSNGQLGYFYGANVYSTPSQAGLISNAATTSAGNNATCAVLFTGGVDCWGNDQYGQLGNGETEQYSTSPIPVIGISTATSVSMGANFACATLANGTVDCWGNGNSGDLGNGLSTQETSPIVVAGITNAVQVSAGYDFACALLSTGSIDCWGDNSSDAIGTSSDSNSTSEFNYSVGSITNATQVAAGQDGVCALLSTGSIDCWGDNTDGDLGNGATTPSLVPVSVSGITTATSVTMGNNFACAVASGLVDCWGVGNNDQLGNGNNQSSDTPVQVSSLTGATAVSAGIISACAVTAGGAVSCWGSNNWDELGYGGGGGSDVPVLINGLDAVTPEPTYTVSFDTAGGNSVSNQNFTVGGTALTLPTPTKTDYTFNGWFTASSGGTQQSSPYSPSASTTLYAQWNPDVFTVGFNAEGGSTASSQSFTVGGTALTLPSPTLTGYAFNGWYTAPTGGTHVSSPYSPSASTTLYAQWTADTYTVTLNADGGSVSATSEPYTVGNGGVTLPTPYRVNYSFQGWFTAASGGTRVASPYTPTASITVYAQWQRIEYNVSLNPEGGSVSPAATSVSAGTSLTLPIPTYTGHTFDGWYSAAIGGTLAVSPYMPSTSVTLYAQWTASTYVVTYDANGGSVSPSSSTFNIGGTALTLAVPTRSGYRFDGWYSASTGGALEASPYTPTASLTLHAKWTANVPGKPRGVTISRSKNVVSVHWTGDNNASHYVCTLSRGSSSPSVQRMTTTTDRCTFTVSKVLSAYRVSVVATNAAGSSAPSLANLAR